MEWRLFADVPPEDVRRLLAIARRRTFARNEVVFHRGDPANALHLIVEGRFAVAITTPLGETAMLGVRGPGEAFGDLALVSGGTTERSATVSALEPGETRVVLQKHDDRRDKVLGEHLVGTIPLADPDYEARFLEVMDSARQRRALFEAEEDQ